MQGSLSGAPAVSDDCYAAIARAMTDFVNRRQHDLREIGSDTMLEATLDERLSTEAARFEGSHYSGSVEADMLAQILERYIRESGKPLESFAVLRHVLERWCEDKWTH